MDVDIDQLMVDFYGFDLCIVGTHYPMAYYTTLPLNTAAEKGSVERLFYADNDKLEFIWTIIPVIVLAALILYGLCSPGRTS